MTIRKIGDAPDVVFAPLENMPLLSAMDDMRKPISPRATIAPPKMEAGYSDIGLRGLGETWSVEEGMMFCSIDGFPFDDRWSNEAELAALLPCAGSSCCWLRDAGVVVSCFRSEVPQK